ncbi:MAG: hypothetical protein U0838_14910 [Chloroflexota bacterium]
MPDTGELGALAIIAGAAMAITVPFAYVAVFSRRSALAPIVFAAIVVAGLLGWVVALWFLGTVLVAILPFVGGLTAAGVYARRRGGRFS